MTRTLYDKALEHSSCGVGFITDKLGCQSHDVLLLSHGALCEIPHRGGMSSEGIGDGAGVNIDLSVNFYRHLTGIDSLEAGGFGVANFFFPESKKSSSASESLILESLAEQEIEVLLWRVVPTNPTVLNAASRKVQPAIRQLVFLRPKSLSCWNLFEKRVEQALIAIESHAFTEDNLAGLYPLSMSSRTQVYKNRLNSWEVIPFFEDLSHSKHWISSLFFHTRFSTNTAPNPMFAQPFRRMAHNGELNTDRKNRLSEDAIARQHGKTVVFPLGQSDSARLDQTLARRISEDHMSIDTAILAMMPPAWENDDSYPQPVRDMLEYFNLYEEKNDGPAALIFNDGVKIGARLDRLGLRPLRTEETDRYLTVASESGQFNFPPDDVIRRGRIEAGGMILFDHATQEMLETREILERMASEKDYSSLLGKARITLADLPTAELSDVEYGSPLKASARHLGYSMHQESFKFMLDPMLQKGAEMIFSMGYGVAPNALAADEGGMSRYFSQRFAQVTNPPLDSIREADGMTLRVSLGGRPYFSESKHPQLTIDSPVLQPHQLLQIEKAGVSGQLSVATVETLFAPDLDNSALNQESLQQALGDVCDQVEALASSQAGIIILSDKNLARDRAALPAVLTISAVNQRLIKTGMRFNTSLVYMTGQACSTHDVAVILGFGASAICPITVFNRALELFENKEHVQKALDGFQKAVAKSLMKTMGKFGLCTVESYISGEFFEANFINTLDPLLKSVFPNIHSPVGGAGFSDIAESSARWHKEMLATSDAKEAPLLGLFKERSEGSGHSFGHASVRVFEAMTHEDIIVDGAVDEPEIAPTILPNDHTYTKQGFGRRTPEQIDTHEITPAYKDFCRVLGDERALRPATLRDVFSLPINLNDCATAENFKNALSSFHQQGNRHYAVQGLQISVWDECSYRLVLCDGSVKRYGALLEALQTLFPDSVTKLGLLGESLTVSVLEKAGTFFAKILEAPAAIDLADVQPAHEITAAMASGAMSHGALVSKAHIAAAVGTNMVGAMSNSGEGGESSSRYNSLRASRIKQFASGRFGIWAGYLADPCLEEIEIKIAQGAKPGEGGQLPAAKVSVEIAAARGGTPGVELVSPPPHHDTYSIEDLGQLIHDAKAARVRVIVKLVSSEGIGTIAVGVAKAGADLINVAAGTGGTGAAQVTSLKHAGRVAEMGIAEVHQALSENGIRDKVLLRCSNAHQTGLDLVKSAMQGGDSFEFGTTALMMLRCVMAKNCHIKCPAGLTTEHEEYRGDARALAQYYINLAHDVRHILASLGFKSLREIRGRSDLMHLINHEKIVGQLDMTQLLKRVVEIKVEKPVYLEANFDADDYFFKQFEEQFRQLDKKNTSIAIYGGALGNCNKTTGGQLSIDIERFLNYKLSSDEVQRHHSVKVLSNGRKVLEDDTVCIETSHTAGQSFGAFNNTGITFKHTGTCNDGVGKSMSGGRIVVTSHGGGKGNNENVLVGNFALFGATGGQLYVRGQAGDRFGVRNSGAVAVVEGVGDFCAEYMTNGSIINLGGFGKGFGNGMSGGTAYQYDVSHSIETLCSLDAVKVIALNEESDFIVGHRQAVLWHLQRHVESTGSIKAQYILDNWEQEIRCFYALIPTALYDCHCADSIGGTHTRKQMLEELSRSISVAGLKKIKASYESKQSLFNGEVPGYGDCDNALICTYIIKTGFLHRAMQLALKNTSAEVDKTAKNLIVNLDYTLIDSINKDVKVAIENYSDDALACLLAEKRVSDYKQASSLREVCDTAAIGSTVWIIDRDKINSALLSQYEPLSRILAIYYAEVLGQFMISEAA